MAAQLLPPATNPCGPCPYRRDVPSGVWAREEYLKLPSYDRETGQQPSMVFLCHQQTGHACAGWCGTHNMAQSLGLRFAAMMGNASTEAVNAIMVYKTDVPLFASGKEACEHGLKQIRKPSAKAHKTILDLRVKKLTRERTKTL